MYDQNTKDWNLYEAGKKYNNNLQPNYYSTVDLNLSFFSGDQWKNVEVHDLQQPVFNIIKRVITFFVASLTSNKTTIQFEPLAYAQDGDNPELMASEMASAEVKNLLEKFKFEHRIRDALFDAAITGDACAHFWFDRNKKPYGGAFGDVKGEICMELVDGCNVMFGNANNPNVEIQPYIIIVGRDMVENLKEEAKQFKRPQSDLDNITEDKDYTEQAGDSGKIEVEADQYGKALYILVYRRDKKTGHIKVSKSVKSAYIYQDIDTGLNYYPIAWLNWEKQKNQYHGRAVATGMLPNQVFINKMFAMVMYHLMMAGFPKAVYDKNKIKIWDNRIGTAIGVDKLTPNENVGNIATYLQPGNMSNQIVQALELAIQYTKEMMGITDASMGNVAPENTSAIIATQKSTIIPLDNPRANMYEFVEDAGTILLDMMGTYYGPRPIVIERDSQKGIEPYDFNQLKNLWLNTRVDVGSASYWSEIAAIQTLDNLLRDGKIEFVEYLERVPDEYIPQKAELISQVKQKLNATPPPQPDLPNISIKFETLPEVARAQILQQIGIQVNPEDFQPILPQPPEQGGFNLDQPMQGGEMIG